MELIRVGISACLVGQEVRYNGAHKKNDRLLDVLGSRFQLIPVCPEVEMGLGTPREPMNLYRTPDGLRMITVDTRIDHSDGMRAYTSKRLEELAAADVSGFVLKKDSPSCGVTRTPTYELDGSGMRRDGRGLFAAAVMERFPHMPVDDEVSLMEPETLEQFIERVVAYSRRSPRRQVRVVRVTAVGCDERADVAATEEPLEVRLHDRPFAVIMRTPGADRELAAGFLLAEGVITNGDELGAVEHCQHPDHPHVHNVVNAFLLGDAARDVAARLDERRNVIANSSCGICGRTTIESLCTRAAPLERTIVVSAALVRSLPEDLRARQPLFDETGGLHAAGIFREWRMPHDRRRRRPTQCCRQGDRPVVACRTAAAVVARSRRVWPRLVRDRPEGVACQCSGGLCGFRSVEPGDRSCAGSGHHAHRVRTRRHLQRVLACGSRASVKRISHPLTPTA